LARSASVEPISWVVTDPDDVEMNAILVRAESKARVALAKQFGDGYSVLNKVLFSFDYPRS
jgi:hypothetical protein